MVSKGMPKISLFIIAMNIISYDCLKINRTHPRGCADTETPDLLAQQRERTRITEQDFL